MEELGPDVWNAAGIKILGTPVGTAEFEHEVCAARLAEEDKLRKAIKWIPDLQCAWQVLVQCAGPRCHHFLRTMPPSRSSEYAVGHDVGMLHAMESLPGDARQQEVATQIASLPMRLGGLGIRSASRMAPSAFWASWADALPMLQDRLPSISNQIADVLDGAQAPGCLGELQTTTQVLDRNGFVSRPGWRALQGGACPPHQQGSEPGEWPHGWQYFASSASEHHFRETVALAQSCAADQAHLRSRLTSDPLLIFFSHFFIFEFFWEGFLLQCGERGEIDCKCRWIPVKDTLLPSAEKIAFVNCAVDVCS